MQMSKEFNEEWPRRINVMKVMSYDTEQIYEQIMQYNRENSDGKLEIGFDDIVEMIYNYANDDFGCEWGHQSGINNLIFQDENGEEY
jgi:hypothetical protein